MTKQMTKTQLVDENIRLRAECERLNAALTAALAYTDTLKQRIATPATPAPRATRPVFEFDPTIAGDYQRACTLARERNGSVRRAQA